jgi:hypothetical protein
VVEPPSYGGWPATNMLDDTPTSGFACAQGQVAGNVFVFELPTPATIAAFEFDTTSIDGNNRAARDVTVEVSPTSKDAGFAPVLAASLDDRRDGQRFAAQRTLAGAWVRLTLVTNHGDAKWTELMGFRGFASPRPPQPAGELSGTYHTDYHDFHLRQQGTALTGCHEYREGLFDGAIEGRVMKLTWGEGSSTGPAVFAFASDGASFRGYWWRGTDRGAAPAGAWNGTRAAAAAGSSACTPREKIERIVGPGTIGQHSRERTRRAIASEQVRPGESMPSRCTQPG